MIISTYKKIIAFFAIIVFIWGCRTAKETCYSYNVERYTVDTVNRFLNFSSILSYGDYLFEYKITTHFNKVIHGDDKPIESIVYDTTGIYLLSGKRKQYCEFDTFALQSKIISKGPFSAKPRGAGVTPFAKTVSSDTYCTPPKAISMNHIQCYYSDVLLKNEAIKDTIATSILLIKKENFNSFYKIRGMEFMDKTYCVVGLRLSHLLKAETFVEQINNLRPLTEKEIRICRSMVKASGL